MNVVNAMSNCLDEEQLDKSQIKKLEEDKDTATDIDRYIHRKAIRWEG